MKPKLPPRLTAVSGGVIRRHWQRLLRIRERLRFSEETIHLFFAGTVGVLGGVTNFIFVSSVEWLKTFSLGSSGDLVDVAYGLLEWQRLLIPALGGIGAGLVLYWGLRLAGPQGASNVLEVVVAGDGRLRMRSALVKAVSSLLTIVSGASIGREGSITQLTATFASRLGQGVGWEPYRLRLLVACGAASGLAAAYNAPVAGAVFAAQIVLGSFSMTHFAPVVFASVIATMVSRFFFGIAPLYRVIAFEDPSLGQLPLFLLLGILSGGLGAVFLKMLQFCEERFARLNLMIYDRLGLGGLLVGCIAIYVPEVWGNGYGVTNKILMEEFLEIPSPILFMAALLLAKLLATVVSVGSGAVGGVFTPTLFLGAALGSLFGTVAHQLGWAGNIHVGAFALVGMGSILSATVHSPLLAVILVFEISLNYSLMPPLMLACAVSTVIARRLHPDSIYTEPLRRKGVDMDRDIDGAGAAMSKTVGDLMRTPSPPLRETATFREIADQFLRSPNNFFLVVDAENRFLGIIALHDLKEYLNAGQELNSVIAFDVMRPPPRCLTPNQRLLEALPILMASELRNVPVVNNVREFRLVGSVARAEALGLLSAAIATPKPTGV
ncbi:MAG: ClcB-like voltage-gated chloride channel protein [Verrucomicrobia bacterium]|nr:ClcB-like voltage-gated chloride channel protein [Verrucomicrobiota bacterium]